MAGIDLPNIIHVLIITSTNPNRILHHFATVMSEKPNTHGDMIIIIPMTNCVHF
jgi:hypothetical protein